MPRLENQLHLLFGVHSPDGDTRECEIIRNNFTDVDLEEIAWADAPSQNFDSPIELTINEDDSYPSYEVGHEKYDFDKESGTQKPRVEFSFKRRLSEEEIESIKKRLAKFEDAYNTANKARDQEIIMVDPKTHEVVQRDETNEDEWWPAEKNKSFAFELKQTRETTVTSVEEI